MAIRFTIGSDWLAANPPAPSSLTETLARVAERTLSGEDFRHAAREFLGEFPLRVDDAARAAAISERPEVTGDPRHDAYLGALAEHIATLYDIERPGWSVESDRFLDTWWFVSEVPGFRAISIAQTPAAFVKHGVFVPERSLHRVQKMDRREIIAALTSLAEELDSQGVSAQMYVVGGAAIALAFDERRSTRDIQAVFEPKAVVYEAAARVAERSGFAPDWLNDAVKGFLAGEDVGAAPILQLPG